MKSDHFFGKPVILETLKSTSQILTEFVETIPQEKLDLRRGDGFWTIAEHVCHLAQVQPMLLKRFERFVNEDHPEFVPYIPAIEQDAPATPSRMSMASALEQFSSYREKQLHLLAGADEVTWEKTATHPEYEHYSLVILARHVLLHDYWHMYRMEELWLTKGAYLTRLE